MVGQAVPSVAPIAANKYLVKTECFCFDNQTIAAGETVNMPLSFMLSPGLPPNVNLVTLSYTFFDITKNASAEKQLDGVLAYK
jgi:cytochrome c oxidase assembly protein subunit 11